MISINQVKQKRKKAISKEPTKSQNNSTQGHEFATKGQKVDTQTSV